MSSGTRHGGSEEKSEPHQEGLFVRISGAASYGAEYRSNGGNETKNSLVVGLG